MLDADLARPPVSLAGALDAARGQRTRSVQQLAEWVRIPSLTGEEGPGQTHMRALLEEAGAEIHQSEPDVEAMFAAHPDVAQYPTHWQHDLILPYADRERPDRLYMPRYVYSMVETPRWVVADYLVSPVDPAAKVPILEQSRARPDPSGANGPDADIGGRP